ALELAQAVGIRLDQGQWRRPSQAHAAFLLASGCPDLVAGCHNFFKLLISFFEFVPALLDVLIGGTFAPNDPAGFVAAMLWVVQPGAVKPEELLQGPACPL